MVWSQKYPEEHSSGPSLQEKGKGFATPANIRLK